MSTGHKITASELMRRTNRRTFLTYLGAAPTLTAFAGAGLLSSRSAFADTEPLDARERRHRAFVIRRDAAIFQRDMPPDSVAFERGRGGIRESDRELHQVFSRNCDMYGHIFS